MKRYDKWANLVYSKLAKGNLENDADMASDCQTRGFRPSGMRQQKGLASPDVVQPLCLHFLDDQPRLTQRPRASIPNGLRESAMLVCHPMVVGSVVEDKTDLVIGHGAQESGRNIHRHQRTVA